MVTSSTELASQLLKVPLFSPVPRTQLEQLIQQGEGVLQSVYGPGEVLFRAGEHGNALYVLLEGQVRLHPPSRGGSEGPQLALLDAGAVFGEEVLLGDGRRADTAVATGPIRVLELYRAQAQRLFARDGLEPHLERARERFRLAGLIRVLRGTPCFQGLPELELSGLARSATFRTVRRGARVYQEGDPAEHFFLVAEGMVKVGRRVGHMEHIRAYLAAGDFFGDLELEAGSVRTTSVTAQTTVELVVIPAAMFLALKKRHPSLGTDMRRLTREANILLQSIGDPLEELLRVGDRLGVAQSLLVIDLEQCVRCGNCAWSCEQVHGKSRLVRRGETLNRQPDRSRPAELTLLPASCQHCTDAVCMTGCPTTAIRRELAGEVYVEERECIGCGDCAKRCPWGNITIAPIPASEQVLLPNGQPQTARAVKCDNCRTYGISACATNCPTGALKRVDPATHFSAFAQLMGVASPPEPPRPRYATALLGIGTLLGVGGPVLVLIDAVRQPLLRGGSAFGLACGGATLGLLVGAFLYSVRKRLIRQVMRLNVRKSAAPAGSRGLLKNHDPRTVDLCYWLSFHMMLGAGAMALMLLHAGGLPRAPLTAILFWLMTAVIVTGLFGAFCYRILPPLLTTIEESPQLLEDLGEAAHALQEERIELTRGRSDAFLETVNTLRRTARRPTRIVQIYRQKLGLAAFLRGLRDETRTLVQGRSAEERSALDRLLEGAGRETHLQAQRLLQNILRAWLVPHILASVAAAVLLAAHLLQVALY